MALPGGHEEDVEGGRDERLLQIQKITGHGGAFSFPSGFVFMVKSHMHIFGFVLIGAEIMVYGNQHA